MGDTHLWRNCWSIKAGWLIHWLTSWSRAEAARLGLHKSKDYPGITWENEIRSWRSHDREFWIVCWTRVIHQSWNLPFISLFLPIQQETEVREEGEYHVSATRFHGSKVIPGKIAYASKRKTADNFSLPSFKRRYASGVGNASRMDLFGNRCTSLCTFTWISPLRDLICMAKVRWIYVVVVDKRMNKLWLFLWGELAHLLAIKSLRYKMFLSFSFNIWIIGRLTLI